MLRKTLKASTLATLIAIGSSSAMAQNAVQVNGHGVPSDMLDVAAKQEAARMSLPEPTKEIREKVRAELIEQEILKQEALKKGLQNTKEVKTRIQLMNQQILVGALQKDFLTNNKPTDAELKKTYEDLTKVMSGTEYQVSHILVKTEDEAKAILAKLDKGEKFAELAKTSSQDASAEQGGSLGWATPAVFVPEFGAEMSKLKKGEYSKTPVKTQFGYHIVMIQDSREAMPPKFEEVKDQLAQQVIIDKWNVYFAKLKSSAKVK
jgi:peptidyl-prolyl cis-trans isomerase C